MLRERTKNLVTRRQILGGSIAVLTVPSALSAQQSIVSFVKSGGCVIYFRHGATTRSGVDHVEWPRDRQRLLSEEGIMQSHVIGAAFRRHAIPVGEVLASPFARCRDMAEIAFGRVEVRMELLGLLSDEQGRVSRVAYMRDRLSSEPQTGTNRIIISHASNIAEVANVQLAEGEAVVIRPSIRGFDVMETLMPGDW